MKALFAAVLAVSLVGCVHSSPNENTQESQETNVVSAPMPKPTIEVIRFKSVEATFDEIAECQKQGGRVEKAGRLQADHCVITYSDAGKACTKGDDCQSGVCEPEYDKKKDKYNPNKGTCKVDNNPFGCRSFIDNGEAVQICVD